jgi:hypothetical protein
LDEAHVGLVRWRRSALGLQASSRDQIPTYGTRVLTEVLMLDKQASGRVLNRKSAKEDYLLIEGKNACLS